MSSNKQFLDERYIITNQEGFYTVESKEVLTLMIKFEAEKVKQYGLFVIVKKDYSYEIYLPIDITGEFKICPKSKFICVMDDVSDIQYYNGVLLLKITTESQEGYWNVLHSNCSYGIYMSINNLKSELKEKLPKIPFKGDSAITCLDSAFHLWLNSHIRKYSYIVIEIDGVDYIFNIGEESWNIAMMKLGRAKNLLMRRYLKVSNETGEMFYDLGSKSSGMIPLEKVFGPFSKIEIPEEAKQSSNYFWNYGIDSEGLIAGIILFSGKSNNEGKIRPYVINLTEMPAKKVTFVRSYDLEKPQNCRIDLWKISYPNKKIQFLLRGVGNEQNFDFQLALDKKSNLLC